MNFTDPLDDTLTYNQTGLVCRVFPRPGFSGLTFSIQEQMMEYKSGAIWAGYQAPWDKIVYGITIGQRYLMENTTLGIPAIMQSEGETSSRSGCFSTP